MWILFLLRHSQKVRIVDKAREHGIITNVFWSDEPEETRRFLEMGIDVILTNDYNRISQEVYKFKMRRFL